MEGWEGVGGATVCVLLGKRVQRHPYPISAGWSFTASTIFSSAPKSMSAVERTSVMEQRDTMTPRPTA